MGTLPNEEIGNASGLYNLMRNVGGSVGISIVNTLLVRRQQAHRVDMAHWISTGSHVFQDQYQGLVAYLSQFTDATNAMRQAYKMMEGSLNQQAALWAYVDDFRYLAVLCFACAPIAFAMAKVRRRGAPAGVH